MPFVPHTEKDIEEMLQAIGAGGIEDLFDEIPEALRNSKLTTVPGGLNEMQITRLMMERAEQDGRYLNFIGAGAYEHHIPAAVWQLVSRGEFYSAYTPYQAEASQGTLQVVYEFQSMVARLTGMDAANASLYDGASALAEAVLMAVRADRKSHRVLLPSTVHPVYRKVVHAIVTNQQIELVDVPYDAATGTINIDSLEQFAGGDFAALVIPQPNFFGQLEDVNALTDWAHTNNMLAIGLVNPVSLGLLAAPGTWGSDGVDITVGEGQPFGAPLSSGGPYVGFMACKEKYLRQMPGRIIGRTEDLDGKPGFTLTLQAREQHIRRSKATSNICTNQGLLATAATIHMALLGNEGLKRVAAECHANTNQLVELLTSIDGVERVFSGPVYHEAVLRLPVPVEDVINKLEKKGILAGYDLTRRYPELGDTILVCATETRTKEDLETYRLELESVINDQQSGAPRNVRTADSTAG